MMFEVNLIAYRQMRAGDIYKTDDEWKKLFDEFQNIPSGIYFYSYDDAEYPFYIGISRAQSSNIAGRIWAELDDYKEGEYWLVKDLRRLGDLSCFKKEIAEAEQDGLFYRPGEKPPESHFKEFLNKVWITFTFVDQGKPEIPLNTIEAALQDHLVKKLGLAEKWIGAGRESLAKVSASSPAGLVFKFTVISGEPGWEISKRKFFEAFRDIG